MSLTYNVGVQVMCVTMGAEVTLLSYTADTTLFSLWADVVDLLQSTRGDHSPITMGSATCG